MRDTSRRMSSTLDDDDEAVGDEERLAEHDEESNKLPPHFSMRASLSRARFS